MALIRRDSDKAARAAALAVALADGRSLHDGPTREAPQLDPRDAALQDMAARNSQLEAALAKARLDIERVSEEKFEAGRQAGRQEATSRETERVRALDSALKGAQTSLERQLGAERDLAIEIALEALRRVLGDPVHYRDLVRQTARVHAAAIERGTLVRLVVSAGDFTEAAALAELGQVLGQVRVEADCAMPAGTCRFDLSLGKLDASIPAQAQAIEALLIETAENAGSAA